MTPERWREVEQVVQKLLGHPPGTREALLERECGPDATLRREVESLLAASSAAGAFMDQPAIQLRPDHPIADRQIENTPIPDNIGDYRVLRRLGSGGMGVVYLAEQKHPHRRVALKVIRAGARGAHTRMRFAREAEVLGRLKHPGIAQIYEAGHAEIEDEPLAYIAMEFVEGQTLSDYMKAAKPPISNRLRLFAAICDGVHHAHQKGVIHRDLKPSNILVTGEDGIPHPKILDFGIARITDDDSAAVTLSSPQHLIGTLLYMSPEQLEGSHEAIDTRSDVYALGVVGYEMLCGALPYDVRGKPTPEIIRHIAETPTMPIGKVDQRLAGDVETILTKALDKNPQRRYDSAAAMAEDVRRYLGKTPITARRASAWYHACRFAQRNAAVVVAMFTALVGLVGGATFATWQAIEARDERDRAVRAEALADQRYADASEARALAEAEAATSLAVTEFLRTTLMAADPEAQESDETIRDALDRAAENIEADLANQPRVESEVRFTIGKTYRGLGALEKAKIYLDRTLALRLELFGPDSKPVSNILLEIGILQRDQDLLQESVATLTKCLDIRRALFEDPHVEIADVQMHLAATLVRMGRHQEAVALHKPALETRIAEHGEDDLTAAQSLSSLGIAYRYLGRMPEAEAAYRRSLAIRRNSMRDDHPHIAVTLHNLGRVLNDLGRYDEAAEVMEESLELMRRSYQGSHPRTANCLSSYASVLIEQARLAEADKCLSEALAMQRELYPGGHQAITKTLAGLARLRLNENDLDSAETLLNEAVAITENSESVDERWAIASFLTELYLKRNELDRAEELLKQLVGELTAHYGEEHEKTANAYMMLGEVEHTRQQPDKAMAYVRKSLDLRRRIHGEAHPLVAESRLNLALVLIAARDFEAAHLVLEEAVPQHPVNESQPLAAHVGLAFELGRSHDRRGELASAEEHFQACLATYKRMPGNSAATRTIECAYLLQQIAEQRDEPSDYLDDIEAAIAHAEERLGTNAYAVRLVGAIRDSQAKKKPSAE